MRDFLLRSIVGGLSESVYTSIQKVIVVKISVDAAVVDPEIAQICAAV